jgi:hypothetical protein
MDEGIEADMNIAEYLKTLKSRSKRDPIPGTFKDIPDLCTACGGKMIFKAKCCSNPSDIKECVNGNCRLKISVTSDSV